MKGTTQPLMTILDITCTPVNLYTDITCVQIRHIHVHIDHGSAFIGGIEHLQWYHSLYSPKEITWELPIATCSSTCDLYTVYMCFMQQASLVPRPSLDPVFDCLQCAKMEGEFKAWFIHLKIGTEGSPIKRTPNGDCILCRKRHVFGRLTLQEVNRLVCTRYLNFLNGL